LAREEPWRTAWRARSLPSRTTRSSRPATGARSRRTVAERGTRWCVRLVRRKGVGRLGRVRRSVAMKGALCQPLASGVPGWRSGRGPAARRVANSPPPVAALAPERAVVTRPLFGRQVGGCVRTAGRSLDERGSRFYREGIAVNDHTVVASSCRPSAGRPAP
jgi:hypothetical protein